jgi:hypothetical protein
MAHRLVRRPTTPFRSRGLRQGTACPVTSSASGKQVSAVSMVAGLWSLSFVLNTQVASLMGHPRSSRRRFLPSGSAITAGSCRQAIRRSAAAAVSAGFLRELNAPYRPRPESAGSASILAFPAIVPCHPSERCWCLLVDGAARWESLNAACRSVTTSSIALGLPSDVCLRFRRGVARKLWLGEQVGRRKAGGYRLDELLGKYGRVYRAPTICPRPSKLVRDPRQQLAGRRAGHHRALPVKPPPAVASHDQPVRLRR